MSSIVLTCATIDAAAMAVIRDFYLLANRWFVKSIIGYNLSSCAQKAWPTGHAILTMGAKYKDVPAVARAHYTALLSAFRDECENRAGRIGTLPRDLRNVITDMLIVVTNGDCNCSTMLLGTRHNLPDLPYDLRLKRASLRARWASGLSIAAIDRHVSVAFGPNICYCNCGWGKSHTFSANLFMLAAQRCVCGEAASSKKTQGAMIFSGMCNTHNRVKPRSDPHNDRVKLLEAATRLAAVSHDIRYALVGGRPGAMLRPQVFGYL